MICFLGVLYEITIWFHYKHLSSIAHYVDYMYFAFWVKELYPIGTVYM